MKGDIHMSIVRVAMITTLLLAWHPAMAFDAASSWSSPGRSLEPYRNESVNDTQKSPLSAAPRYWEPPPDFQQVEQAPIMDDYRYNRSMRYSGYPPFDTESSAPTNEPIDASRPLTSAPYWDGDSRHGYAPKSRTDYGQEYERPIGSDPRFDYAPPLEQTNRSPWNDPPQDKSQFPQERPRPNAYTREAAQTLPSLRGSRSDVPTSQRTRPADRFFDAKRQPSQTWGSDPKERDQYTTLEELDHLEKGRPAKAPRYAPNRHEFPDERYSTRPDYTAEPPLGPPNESEPPGRTYGQPINPWR